MSERSPPDGGSRTSPDGGQPSRLQAMSERDQSTTTAALAGVAAGSRSSIVSAGGASMDQAETEGEGGLVAFLVEHNLAKYAEVLRADGVHKVDHLRDVVEGECVQQWGMSGIEARRLVRVYEKWKKQRKIPITKKLARILGGNSSSSIGSSVAGSAPTGFSNVAGSAGGGGGGGGKHKLLTSQSSGGPESVPASVCVIQPQELRITQLLGKGSFGTVNEAVWTMPSGGSRPVAVKTLDATKDTKLASRFIKEANILQQVSSHPHIIRLLGIGIDSLMLVTELATGGSLLSRLRQRPMPISVLQLCAFARQVAEAMVHLEQKGLVHRDLAARNVLLMDAHTCKISDFGLSRVAASDLTPLNRTYATPVPIAWTAPEAVTKNLFSHKSDVWSYGVTVWEMFSKGQKPYQGKGMIEIIQMIQPPTGYRLPRPALCSPPTYEIIKTCWHDDPAKRPNFRLLRDLIKDSRPHIAKVICSHKPIRASEDELVLTKGEIVTIIDDSDPLAYFGQNSNMKTGTFPAGRVVVVMPEASTVLVDIDTSPPPAAPPASSFGGSAAAVASAAAAMAAQRAHQASPTSSSTAGARAVTSPRASELYDDVVLGGQSVYTNTDISATFTGEANAIGAMLDASSPRRRPGLPSAESYMQMSACGLASPPLPESDYANAELAAAHFASGKAPSPAREPTKPGTPTGYMLPSEPQQRLSAAMAAASAAQSAAAGHATQAAAVTTAAASSLSSHPAMTSSSSCRQSAAGGSSQAPVDQEYAQLGADVVHRHPPPVDPFQIRKRTAGSPAAAASTTTTTTTSVTGGGSQASSSKNTSQNSHAVGALAAAKTQAPTTTASASATSAASALATDASPALYVNSKTTLPLRPPIPITRRVAQGKQAATSDSPVDQLLMDGTSGTALPPPLIGSRSSPSLATVASGGSGAGGAAEARRQSAAGNVFPNAALSSSSQPSPFAPTNPFSAGASPVAAEVLRPSPLAAPFPRRPSADLPVDGLRAGGDKYSALRADITSPQRSGFMGFDQPTPQRAAFPPTTTAAAAAASTGAAPGSGTGQALQQPAAASTTTGYMAVTRVPREPYTALQLQQRRPAPCPPGQLQARFPGQALPSPPPPSQIAGQLNMQQLASARPAIQQRGPSLPYQAGSSRTPPTQPKGNPLQPGSDLLSFDGALSDGLPMPMPLTQVLLPLPAAVTNASTLGQASTSVPPPGHSQPPHSASSSSAAAPATGAGGWPEGPYYSRIPASAGFGTPLTPAQAPAWPLAEPPPPQQQQQQSSSSSARSGSIDDKDERLKTLTVGNAFKLAPSTVPASSSSSSSSRQPPLASSTPKQPQSAAAPPASSKSTTQQPITAEQETMLAELMSNLPGRSRPDCVQALRTGQWNVKSAQSYMSVRELLALDIPGVDAVSCLRALEHSNWKVDRAAEWLLTLQGDP